MVSNFEQLKETLRNATGIPGTYYQFKKDDAPGLPFFVYFTPGIDSLAADNHNYANFPKVYIELYTELKDEDMEKRIESVLDENDMPYTKTQEFLDEEDCWMTLYNTSFVEE